MIAAQLNELTAREQNAVAVRMANADPQGFKKWIDWLKALRRRLLG